MVITRRTLLASLGATLATPAWAQAIGPQSDPWAQVDPYADARNGFPAQGRAESGARPNNAAAGVFQSPSGGMDEKDEIALGRDMYPRMVADFGGAYPNPKMQVALREFCRPMFAASDRPHLPWEVTLVNDRSPNAAAFGGGKVVVNAGLLPMCDSAGELAATLAHEIGHVDKYHTVRSEPLLELLDRLRKSGAGADLNGSLQALVGGSGKGAKDVWEVFELAYSREDEAEADAHEMVILERLGVDPIHAIRDQENFAKLAAGRRDIPELLRTHPRNADRLAHIQALAAMQKRPAQDFVFPGWDTLKAAFPTHPAFKKT